MNRMNGRLSLRRQSGITLIMALIFLAMLALLGATAARNSVLEERMAGNTRDRDLAFQAAEAALKFAESNIGSGINLRTQLGAAGVVDASNCTVPNVAPCYLAHGNDADYWAHTFVWSTANARDPGLSVQQVAEQPLYVVEKIPNAGAGTTETYRITARGVGASSGAVVINQSVVNFTP
jgi:type IV pilus assembly protein PilX